MIRVLKALGAEPTPSKPGPGPVPESLLKALELTIARRVEGLLAGDHRSALLGRGTELAQVRPYVPGDDVRLIDWNVTARTTEPHVRVHLAERVLVTWIVLDTTPSMAFGTAERRKADVALGATLAVGHAATIRGNRVGLVGFGGDGVRVVPPRQGRAGLVGLLLALRDGHEPRRRSPERLGLSPLAEALRQLGAVARQRALVVVVSDFRGERDWRRPLLEVAGRHEVVAVEVRDPREQALEPAGTLFLVDPETGRELRVDTSTRASARASPRRRPRSGQPSRASLPPPASPTSRSRPIGTGCATSPSSSAGGARELPVAARSDRARSRSRCSWSSTSLAARRQRRAAGRFTNPALVPNLVPLVAAVAAVRPVRPRSRRTDAPRRRDRAPARRPLGHA